MCNASVVLKCLKHYDKAHYAFRQRTISFSIDLLRKPTMIGESSKSALTTIANALKKTTEVLGNSTSLIDKAKGLQVEPLTLVDSSLVHDSEIMPDVMQTLQSQFTGFWLQAADVVGNVESAKAIATLDRLNPNRDASYRNMVENAQKAYSREHLYASQEAYTFGLPTNNSHTVKVAAVENSKNNDRIHEVANLAVGKMVNVCLTTGQDATGQPVRREFRVAIRLMTMEMAQDTCLRLVGDQSTSFDMMRRIRSWMNNDIGLADLVFGIDLIKERKRQLLADKDGVYEEVRRRQLGHKRAGLFSGSTSVAEISNLVVLSKETTEMIQAKHGLDVTDSGDRDKIMNNMQAMILVVVDRMNLRVHFYYHGIRNGSSMGVNDIRIANRKQNGPDLMDIFNQLKEGNAVRY